MTDPLDKVRKPESDGEFESELEAIRGLIGALTPLNKEARMRVISYAFKRLGIPAYSTEPSLAIAQPVLGSPPSERPTVVDIRTLKDEKQPSSAREMAVLVAYYLAEAAPANERKGEINADDVRQYFKQAGFRLPAAPEMTLVHTRNAGYLDNGSSRGLYRLNPVGYNLIVHSLPATSEVAKPMRRRKAATKNARR